MNDVSTTTVHAPTFSADSRYRATLVLNGKTTNIDCGHSHKTRADAQRCAEGDLPPMLDALRKASLVRADVRRIGRSVWDAYWRDAEGQFHSRRFLVFD